MVFSTVKRLLIYVYIVLFYTYVCLPVVTVTPFTQSVEVTHTAVFTATVTGDGPFYYQWQRGHGHNLTNETGNTLIIHNVTDKLNQSNYRCIITNNYGCIVISNTVKLQVTSM